MAKKGGKGKGKGKGGKDDVDEEMIEKFHVLEYKLQALQLKTVLEQERAEKEKSSENELKSRVLELERDFIEEQEKLIAITSDMTRQYKQMQDALLKDMKALKQTSLEKDNILKQKDEKIAKMTEEYEYRLKIKDDEVNKLKTKIEEMSKEFAAMLQDTLNKMQERVDMAPWDTETDPQMMKKFKEIAGTNAP